MNERVLKQKVKLLEIRDARIEFATKHHINTRGERLDFKAFPHIRAMYDSVSPSIVIQGSVQAMKAASLDSKVHTPTGWRRMGDLQVGDSVTNPNGDSARIVQIQPRGVQQLFSIALDDGRQVEVCGDHLWKVLRSTRRSAKSEKRGNYQWDVSKDFEILSTSQIRRALATGKHRFKIPVPEKAVEKPAKSLVLDPYFVGLMLGDGELCERNLRFSSEDHELIQAVNAVAKRMGLKLSDCARPTKYFKKIKGHLSQGSPQSLKALFGHLGLLGTRSHTKFIPEAYKNGSVEQRFEVLRGLLDTDGCAAPNGEVWIELTSHQLILDIQEIVHSLGGATKISKRATWYTDAGERKSGKDAWKLRISMPKPADCFKLSRKRSNVSNTHRRRRTLGSNVVSVELGSKQQAQCIALDSKNHLYLMDDYVVTHNSEFVVVDHLAMAYSGLSVFFVIPKSESRNTYVQNRVNKCVQSVSRYKEIIGEGFFDSMVLKSFGQGTVKYVGSNTKSDFVEYPADSVYVDEVDQCNAENLNYALDRTRASPYQFSRYIGNPSEPNRGINRYFLDSDQREWHVPCWACNRLCEVDWFKSVVAPITNKGGDVVDYRLRDTEWRPGIFRDVHLICPHCQGRLLRESKRGQWLATKLDAIDVEGYHISMMASLLNTISGMWKRFQAAQVDSILLKQFYNSELGLSFAAAGNKLTPALLQKCCVENYNFIIKDDCAHLDRDEHVGPCSMGIDVGGAFDVRISHLTPRGNRLCVFIGKVRHTSELYDLMERYNVQIAVMDAEPEASVSKEVQALAQNTVVWLCKYKPREGSAGSMVLNDNDLVLNIDRTEALDKSFVQLKRHKNLLPQNYAAILGGTYENEMCMPVREAIEDKQHRRRYVWTKGEDHARHADTYDMLAAQLMAEETIQACIG